MVSFNSVCREHEIRDRNSNYMIQDLYAALGLFYYDTGSWHNTNSSPYKPCNSNMSRLVMKPHMQHLSQRPHLNFRDSNTRSNRSGKERFPSNEL
jgi:hypothetical protein